MKFYPFNQTPLCCAKTAVQRAVFDVRERIGFLNTFIHYEIDIF